MFRSRGKFDLLFGRKKSQGLLTEQMWGVRRRERVKDETYFFTLSKRNTGGVIYRDEEKQFQSVYGGSVKRCIKRSISDFN